MAYALLSLGLAGGLMYYAFNCKIDWLLLRTLFGTTAIAFLLLSGFQPLGYMFQIALWPSTISLVFFVLSNVSFLLFLFSLVMSYYRA